MGNLVIYENDDNDDGGDDDEDDEFFSEPILKNIKRDVCGEPLNTYSAVRAHIAAHNTDGADVLTTHERRHGAENDRRATHMNRTEPPPPPLPCTLPHYNKYHNLRFALQPLDR